MTYKFRIKTSGDYEIALDDFQAELLDNDYDEETLIDEIANDIFLGELEEVEVESWSIFQKESADIFIIGYFYVTVEADNEKSAIEKAKEEWRDTYFGELDNLDIEAIVPLNW